MKKLLVVAALFALSTQAAYAGDRIILYPGTNPSSTQANLGNRLERLSNGTFIRDALGASAIAGGVYSNLTVVPNGGMNLAVQPTNSTLGPGVLYQLGQLDTRPLPQGATSTNQLSADTTPIAVNAIQPSSIGGLGPITAPATGTSEYILVEGQVQTNDTTPKLFGTLSPTGGQSTETVPSLRQDQFTYQIKYGTAAASPTKPLVDAGWIPVADVLVPAGTTTITGGMIAMRTPFSGFAQNGLAGNFSTLTLGNTGSGCLQSNSSGGVISLPCTSGLGQVVGTSPVTATTNSGVATVGLGHGDYGDLTNAQTITGAKTFSQSVAVGGSATSSPSLTVSANPSTPTTYSPRIYVAQNVAGGGKYGLDSLNNQLRVLYTPYTIPGSAEIALGYFDTSGQYHVGASTYGVNANVAGNLTAGSTSLGTTLVNGTITATTGALIINDMRTWRSANAATGAIFFGQTGQNYLYWDGTQFNMTGTLSTPGGGSFGGSGVFAGGLSVTGGSSTIANDLTVNGNIASANTISAGGNIVAAGGVTGNALTSTGAATIASGLSVGAGASFGGDIRIQRSAGPSSGALFFGNSGSTYLFYDGANYTLSGGGFYPSTVNASGAITASNFTTPSSGALPFYAGVGGNVHITAGAAQMPGGVGQSVHYTFNGAQVFGGTPICTASYDYGAALPNTWTPISFSANGGGIRIYGEGLATVEFICIGV